MKTFKSIIALVLIAFCLLAAGCNQEVAETVACTEVYVVETQETTESILVEGTEETTLVETSIEVTESEVEEDVIPEQSSNFCEVITVSTTAETSVCGYPLATESSAVATETTASTPTYGSTPDTSLTWQGFTISEYNVDGYGTVYGYFVDTSSFNTLVNNHLVEIGKTPYPTTTTYDYERTRAIECTVNFSHTRPNGQPNGDVEIIAATADSSVAFDVFRNSPAHWSHVEAGADEQYTNLSSAAFVRVVWLEGYGPNGGYGWAMESSALVAHI